jgi:hypothetical protein
MAHTSATWHSACAFAVQKLVTFGYGDAGGLHPPAPHAIVTVQSNRAMDFGVLHFKGASIRWPSFHKAIVVPGKRARPSRFSGAASVDPDG